MLLPLLIVFAFGACIGSFVNVLVYRLPESQSVVRPGSRCRSCGKALAWYENVPILSYLLQRGRCRGCRARVSVQYPLVELAVAALFAGNFLIAGGGSAGSLEALVREPRWIVGAVFTTLLLTIAVTDLRTYLIPDELSIGGTFLGLAASFVPGEPSPRDAVLGAVAGFALLYGVAWLGALVFRKEAMGGGDIKMMAMVGAFVGWQGVFLTLFLGALLGSLIYGPVTLLQRARSSRREAVTHPARGESVPAATDERSGAEISGEELDRALVPFGFFLAPAAALTYYLGDGLVRGYLRLIGAAP